MVKVGVAEAPKRVFSAEELKVLDTDGDGDIDVEDLQKLVKVQHAQEKLIRLQKYGILFLSLVVCGVGKLSPITPLSKLVSVTRQATESQSPDALASPCIMFDENFAGFTLFWSLFVCLSLGPAQYCTSSIHLLL